MARPFFVVRELLFEGLCGLQKQDVLTNKTEKRGCCQLCAQCGLHALGVSIFDAEKSASVFGSPVKRIA